MKKIILTALTAMLIMCSGLFASGCSAKKQLKPVIDSLNTALNNSLKDQFTGNDKENMNIHFSVTAKHYYPELGRLEAAMNQSFIAVGRLKTFLTTESAQKAAKASQAKAFGSACSTFINKVSKLLAAKDILETAVSASGYDTAVTINFRNYAAMRKIILEVTATGIKMSKIAVATLSSYLGDARHPSLTTAFVTPMVFENIALENFVHLINTAHELFIKKLDMQNFVVYEGSASAVTLNNILTLGNKLASISSADFVKNTEDSIEVVQNAFLPKKQWFDFFIQKTPRALRLAKKLDSKIMTGETPAPTDLTKKANYQLISEFVAIDLANEIESLNEYLNWF